MVGENICITLGAMLVRIIIPEWYDFKIDWCEESVNFTDSLSPAKISAAFIKFWRPSLLYVKVFRPSAIIWFSQFVITFPQSIKVYQLVW